MTRLSKIVMLGALGAAGSVCACRRWHVRWPPRRARQKTHADHPTATASIQPDPLPRPCKALARSAPPPATNNIQET